MAKPKDKPENRHFSQGGPSDMKVATLFAHAARSSLLGVLRPPPGGA